MKKFTIILTVLIVAAITTNAQTTIPNYGFESWSTYNGIIEVPDNWHVETITSSVTDLNGTHIYDVVSSASQTTDSYAGNYAIALSNKLSFIDYFGNTYSLWGKTFTLPPDGSLQNLKSAFPVSARHTTLNGYYKFTPANGDSCQFIVLLYKSGYVNSVNPQSGNMIGYGSLCKSTSSSYTPFTVTINYFDSTTIPDSASIALSAFKQVDFNTMTSSGSPLGNSVLYVDNISFDGFIPTEINTLTNTDKKINIFPNPASDVFTLNIDNTINADFTLNIYKITGELVRSEILRQNQQKINISDLSNGIYMVELNSKDWTEKQKLIIQR